MLLCLIVSFITLNATSTQRDGSDDVDFNRERDEERIHLHANIEVLGSGHKEKDIIRGIETKSSGLKNNSELGESNSDGSHERCDGEICVNNEKDSSGNIEMCDSNICGNNETHDNTTGNIDSCSSIMDTNDSDTIENDVTCGNSSNCTESVDPYRFLVNLGLPPIFVLNLERSKAR